MEMDSIIDKEILDIRKYIDQEIEENTEYLETTEGDTVECIGVENLAGILNEAFQYIKNYLNEKLRIDGIYMARVKKMEKEYKELKHKKV